MRSNPARTIWPVSLIALFSAVALIRAETPPTKTKPLFTVLETLDQRYHPDDERQVLDVFRPEGVTNAPVVLFVHGGAWMMGDKNFLGLYRAVGRYLAGQGVVAVLANYRLTPAVKHPEHVKDIARAYAWTRRNIKQHGGNPDTIFLCGHSAGAHLVALLATDDSLWRAGVLGLEPKDRDSLRGVMAVSGVYRIPARNDATGMIAELMDNVRRSGAGGGPVPPLPRFVGKSPEFNLFKVVFGDDAKVRTQAGPVNHVRKGLPPFLLLVAERELPMLPQMATEFAQELRKAGNTAEQKRIPGCHHNAILFRLDEVGDPTAKALMEFLDSHAKRPKAPGKN